MRKPAFCICENKDADQLRSNRQADQRLCFHYIDSAIPLLPKSEISSFLPCSVPVQPGLCQTWSETPKTGFLTTKLNFAVKTKTQTKWFYHAVMPSKDEDGIANLVKTLIKLIWVCSVCPDPKLSILTVFLAHLSRRLRGELIVYRSSRRPCVR